MTPIHHDEVDLTQTNPFAVNALVRTSAHRKIVASQDIFDDRGLKLWAKGNAVSESLQERLLDRKLRQPLEGCLTVEDGVNALELKAAMSAFYESDHALARAVLPYASRLADEVAAIPLRSIAQLLLTANKVTRPSSFEHACRAMALAGAMAVRAGASRVELRMALLGGLLHDLGELYINPLYLTSSKPLDMMGYRHLALHPALGQALLARLGSADYPPALARAIGEHHERLDGSGYPARLKRPQVSSLGRLLAVVECAMGVAQSTHAPLASASFVLKFVAGEFDGTYVGFVSQAARDAGEEADAMVDFDGPTLQSVEQRLGKALVQARTLAEAPASPKLKAVADRAASALARLRAAWNSLGLWAHCDAGNVSPQARFELQMAARELGYRLSTVRRECVWFEKALSESEEAFLTPLWQTLNAETPARQCV